MDANETAILGQVLTGIGAVVIGGGFSFITYYLKKHMSDIVAWIDSEVGANNLAKLTSVVESLITVAQKDGIVKDLTGSEKFQQVLTTVKSEESNLISKLGISDTELKAFIEKKWVSMTGDLDKAYNNATETQAQKALDEANAKKAEAEKAQQEANAAKEKAAAALAEAQATQSKLSAAISAVQTATATTATDVATTTDDKATDTATDTAKTIVVTPATTTNTTTVTK